MGQGVAIGLTSQTDNVNKAASNLVPNMNDIMVPGFSMNLGAGANSGSYSKSVIFEANSININATSGDAKEIAMEVRRIIDDYADETAVNMGAN